MIKSIFGETTIKSLAYSLRKELEYITDYVVLDSKYRLIEESGDNDILKFIWSYVPTKNVRIGHVNSCSDIGRIIAIKLDNISMPYGNELYDGALSYNRISAVIDELSTQAYIISDKVKAHWILRNDEQFYTNNKRVEFTPNEFHEGIYWFNKPITSLDNISIKFGSPLYPLTFKFDRDICTATYGITTTLTTTYNHGYNGTFYISIQNFTTDDINADKDIITRMNSHTEIKVSGTGNNIIVPINTSTITPKPGLTFNVFYEDRRIIMPIEIIYKKY